jgi:hypothetical protein
MSVLKRGNSKNWYIQFQIGGRTIIKSSRSTSRKVAEQMETQLRAQVHAGLYLGHKPTLTFGEALARFALSKQGAPNHRNVSGHIKAILRSIRAPTPLAMVSSQQVEEYCRTRKAAGIGSQALKHSLNVIRGAVMLAGRQGFRTSVIAFPTVKVSGGRLRYLSPDEEVALLDALDPVREAPGLALSRPGSQKSRLHCRTCTT